MDTEKLLNKLFTGINYWGSNYVVAINYNNKEEKASTILIPERNK